MFKDLRDFMDAVAGLGECMTVPDADVELEVGAITDIACELADPPMLIFDRIKGFQPGYRVVSHLFTTPRRTALGLGLPLEARGLDLVRAFRDRLKRGISLVPPVEVKNGPVLENVDVGDKVNLLKFPAPRWHEHDGGRYIGTGTACVMRDPDSGWVNLGAYRAEIQDEGTVTVNLAPGHHGHMIRQKYWDRGQSAPIAICCGQAPALFAAAAWEGIPWAVSEYDFAGGLEGAPFEVVRGIATGLPVPARAELVIEGQWVLPEVEKRWEGPFGEFTGYYAGGRRQMAAVRVKAVMYRDNPIIQGNPPSYLPSVWTLGRHLQKAASLWETLDKQITGVRGVWMMEEASIHAMPVISLEQQYPGHAMRAALLAVADGATAMEASVIIVVDEDIDPSNKADVLWALGTRIDERSIVVLPGCWGIREDPMVSPEQVRLGNFEKPRLLILACKPFAWKKQFVPSTKLSPELRTRTIEKWGKLLGMS